MAETIRQQLMNAVDAALKGILKQNGYATDIGLKVYDWHTERLEDEDLPALVYRDLEETINLEGSAYTSHDRLLSLEITALTLGTTTPSEVRKMIADIEQAIRLGKDWGGLAEDTLYTGNKTEIEKEEREIGAVTLQFQIQYDTKFLNSYSQ